MTSALKQLVPDEAAFRAWLADERGLRGRSMRDVVSRVRRALSWGFDILDGRDDAEVLFWLGRRPEFQNCTGNVKSQVRRAVSYYRLFRARRTSK